MNQVGPKLNTIPMTADVKRRFAIRAAAGVGVVGVLALSAPLIWGAASAGAGLLVLGGIAVVGIGALQALPLLGQKYENRLLAARKAEARENPIEQRQNEFARRAAQIKAARDALSTTGAQIAGMRDMLEDQRKQDPHGDFSKQERALQKMIAFQDARVNKLNEANKALEAFKKLIERNIFEWNFAQAGRTTLEQLNAQDQESILNDILNDEAGRSIQDNFNKVCAELDLEVRTLNESQKLEFGPGATLDLRQVHIPEMQTIDAR